MIKVKRVYEEAEEEDGFRILVDRLWPRGLSKEKARINIWLKEIAPSDELRKWFSHNPEKWEEFKRRYWEELDKKPEVIKIIKAKEIEHGTVTLLYGSKEEKYNNAYALLSYLTQVKSFS